MSYRNATKAMMKGVAHFAAGHRIIGDPVRKSIRNREVCLRRNPGGKCRHASRHSGVTCDHRAVRVNIWAVSVYVQHIPPVGLTRRYG